MGQGKPAAKANHEFDWSEKLVLRDQAVKFNHLQQQEPFIFMMRRNQKNTDLIEQNTM